MISATGVALGMMGGLPMLFSGLRKLASWIKAESIAKIFEKAYHITHTLEKKTIDFIIPFKLGYSVYKGLWNIGIKYTKGNKPLSEDEAKNTEEGKKAMAKVENLVYKVLLVFFAWDGIKGALHAGASLLGFVEGAASAVKGVEIASAAEELIKLA